MRVFETVPVFPDASNPLRLLPGNISEDLSRDSPGKGSDSHNLFDGFGERLGSFHEVDTTAGRESFRNWWIAFSERYRSSSEKPIHLACERVNPLERSG